MEPVTRRGMFLDAICDGEPCGLEPATREELMLKRLGEVINDGGSGGGGSSSGGGGSSAIPVYNYDELTDSKKLELATAAAEHFVYKSGSSGYFSRVTGYSIVCGTDYDEETEEEIEYCFVCACGAREGSTQLWTYDIDNLTAEELNEAWSAIANAGTH